MNLHFNHKNSVESKTAEQIALELRQEEKLEALLQDAAGNATPSEKLQRRVAAMAAQHEEKQVRRQSRARVMKRSFALCAAAAFAFIAVRATPFVMAELFLRRVEAAVEKVQSAHTTTWKITEDGKRVKIQEMWQQAGQYRIESWPEEATGRRRQVQIFRAGQMWTYEPQLDKVTLRRTSSPFGTGFPDLTGTGMIREFTRHTMKNTMSVTKEDARINGQPAQRIRVKTTGDMESYDVAVLVDKATDLPVSAEMEVVQMSTGKKLRSASEFEFNRLLEAKLFEPDFPSTARFVDAEKGKEEWRRRLAKGIASRKIGERTVVVRDLQVNEDGHVFLLYTAGRKFYGDKFAEFDKAGWIDASDWRVRLTDNRGTEYVPSSLIFQPTTESMGKLPRSPFNNLVFNGEKLEGMWWVPVQPQRPWKPRRFTVTFHIPQTPWRAVHKKDAWTEAPRMTVTFPIRVSRPASAFVPDYMPFISTFDLKGEQDIRRAEADARGLLPPGAEESPELVGTMKQSGSSVTALTFAPDSRTLASAAGRDGVKLWDVQAGKLRRSLPTEVSTLAYEPDGNTLISATSIWDNSKKEYVDNAVQLWATRSGHPTRKLTLENKKASPRAVAFSRDGSTLMAAGTVGDAGRVEHGVMTVSKMSVQLRAWDSKSGKVLRTVTIPHEAFLPNIVLTPDDKLVTTMENIKEGVNQGSVIRVWDAKIGQQLRSFTHPNASARPHWPFRPTARYWRPEAQSMATTQP
jgi:outer membrane lipoprotein-sorting protein